MKKFVLFFTFISFFSSCSNDDGTKPNNDEEEAISIPKNYGFKKNGESSVDFKKSRILVDMHSILELHAKNSLHQDTDSKDLENMINNTGNPFVYNHNYYPVFYSSNVLNNSTELKLYDLFSSSPISAPNKDEAYQGLVSFFKDIERISKLRLNPAKVGVAGYIFYGNNYDKRLVDEKRIETTQEMTKRIMGAFQLDQIINVHLSSDKLNVDNSNNIQGKNYTAMEHNWDKAFAYTNLPIDSELNYIDNPTASDRHKYGRFWSEYILRVDKTPAGKGIKKNLYKAFILGRQAIVDKDYAKRDAQAKEIKELMSKVCAIRTAYYLKNGLAYLKDNETQGEASHEISEGIGFAYALRYTTKKLNYSTEIDAIKSGNGLWDKQRSIDNISNLISKITSEFNINISDL